MFRTFLVLLVISGVWGDNLKNLIFPPLPPGVLQNDSSACFQDSELYREKLDNFTLWASQMWDATAKSTVGVLAGSPSNFGQFDECLETEAPFPTQYCLVTISILVPEPNRTDPYSLYHHPEEHVIERLYYNGEISQLPRNVVKLGWCIPKSCSPKKLEDSLNRYIDELDLPLKQFDSNYSVIIEDNACHIKDEFSTFSIGQILFCLCVAILLVVISASTIYDIYFKDSISEKKTNKSISSKYLLSFSLKASVKDLFRIEESEPALMLLYGVKLFCIIMIVIDHRFGHSLGTPIINDDHLEQVYRSWYNFIIVRGDIYVDTFFVIAGLLLTYGVLNHLEKRRINPLQLYLLRYIRLTPAYAFVVFYSATVFDRSGDGPLWKFIARRESDDCKSYWWTNLLYLNVYIKSESMCMVHSWYLANDFHFFIIGVLVCLLIKKNTKMGLSLLLGLTVISMIIPLAITIAYERPATMLFYPRFLRGPKEYLDLHLTYIKSHTRAGPYFLGMIGGYIYYKAKGHNVHIKRLKSNLILVASILLMLSIYIGGKVFYDPYHKYNSLEAGIFAGLNRTVFALGTLGLFFCASYGHSKFIYNILSWKFWIPLSKLGYAAYLMHFQIQLQSVSSTRVPFHYNMWRLLAMGISDVVVSGVCALLIYVCIEAPFKTFFKLLLQPPTNKQIDPLKNSTDNFNNTNADSQL